MALSYDECLQIIGVSSDASKGDIETAYRDLMLVWHPDRFSSDERLRKKAEEQAKRINEAIKTLRKGRPRENTTHHRAPHPAPQRPAQPTRETTDSTSRYTSPSYPPFCVYVRFRILLARAAAAVCVLLIGHHTVTALSNTPYDAAFGMLVFLSALYVLLNDLFLLGTGLPVISLHAHGIYLFGRGSLLWHEVELLTSRIDYHMPCLYLEATREYCRRQYLLKRLLFFLRKRIRNTHFIIPFAGFTEHPTTVVHAASAFLSSPLPPAPKAKSSAGLILSLLWWLEILCVCFTVAWWLLSYSPQLIECIPYIAIMTLSHLARLVIEWRELAKIIKRG